MYMYIIILHGHLIELSDVSVISVQWRYYMTDCYLHSLHSKYRETRQGSMSKISLTNSFIILQ